jgi:UDP:flavonoid glycosyltransferase YjiC (YdhE family)
MAEPVAPVCKQKLMVFCRPYLMPDFQENVKSVAERFEPHFLSDGRCEGVADTRARFYELLGKAGRLEGFSDEDELDVIERCRYLRGLPRSRATQMLRSMAQTVSEAMTRINPAVVLSHMVDDYVTHLAAEIARRRGIVFVGYAYSYFPGKIQVTQYANGVPLNGREPADDEVAQTLELISERTFRQNYLQPETYTRRAHLKAMIRYRAKKVVFRYRAWRDHDPLHMHYSCLPFIVERRHWRDFPKSTDFHVDWRTQVKSEAAEDRPVIYFPLGYFPEATIDYWMEDRRILDYQNFVLGACRVLGQRFQVVVKEHLHMLGARSPEFYRAIRDTSGVVSVPPLEFSNDVVELSDVVLMGAGSVGVESFIRGKPVVSFCARSYWFKQSGTTFLDPADMASWPERVIGAIRSHKAPTLRERTTFIKGCLRSTMRVLKPGLRWPIAEPEDLRSTLETAVFARRGTSTLEPRPGT